MEIRDYRQFFATFDPACRFFVWDNSVRLIFSQSIKDNQLFFA
jgi:hypothetical protein